MKYSRIIGVLLAGFIISSCDDGPSSDNGSEFGPWVYSSNEEGDYTLNMAKSVWADDKEPMKIQHSDIVLTTKIPKSLLSVCFPYSRKSPVSNALKVKQLPDEVFCNKISFNMNYVDGKSLKNCDMCSLDEFEDYIRKAPKPHPIIMGKLPEIPRADQHNEDFQRYFEMKADVYVWISSKLGETIGKMIGVQPKHRIGEFEGFAVYREGTSSWTNYVDIGAADGVQHVKCVAPPEKTHPEFFCNAKIVINERLVAEVHFVDFRVHGGRRFLQERIRAFKKHICPILKCSIEALRAAEVVGGF